MKIFRTLVCFVLLTLSYKCTCQVLPEDPTVVDINNFKENISNRSKKIPSNEAELLSERNWLSGASTSLASLKNDLNKNIKTKPNLEKFKQDLFSLVEKIKNLNCQKTDECIGTLEKVKKAYSKMSRDESVINIFEEPKGWSEIAERFNKLYQYFPINLRNQPVKFTAAECQKLKDLFSKPEVIDEVNNFIDLQTTEINNFTKEVESKIAAITTAEAETVAYSKKLNDGLDTASTKNSLQTNLYLMILMIGLLSIATIGVVRLFPENVMKEWVESGQVIQFVTVMILLSVIMALGLAGLLTENTLGTLLGGIGGYVLSQGVGRAAARAAIKDKQTIENSVTSSNLFPKNEIEVGDTKISNQTDLVNKREDDNDVAS